MKVSEKKKKRKSQMREETSNGNFKAKKYISSMGGLKSRIEKTGGRL